METSTIAGIIIGLIIIGLLIYKFTRKKTDEEIIEESLSPKEKMDIRVAHLQAKGMEAEKDYTTAIISLEEIQRRTPEQVENWIKNKFDTENGILSKYETTGLGLQELTYTVGDKIYYIFFLIVDKTKYDIIPIEEDPVPDEPIDNWIPFVFEPFEEVYETPESKIIDIILPTDGSDVTKILQEQIDAFPNGTKEAPTIVRIPEGVYWTEGEFLMGYGSRKSIIHFNDKHFFIVEGGEFFTKAPNTPYGGNVGKSRYSNRRHVRFEGCTNFKVRKMKITGSNLVDGEVIGTTPELTPDFWYETNYITENANWEYLRDENGNRITAGVDSGAIRIGFPVYKSYWEFEHAFDFLNCQNFIAEDLYASSVFGDGICLGQRNANFIIRDCYLDYMGRQGMAFYDVKNFLVERVEVHRGRRAALDLEPNGDNGYVLDGEIRNCYLQPMMTVVAALGRGLVSNINFHHNKYQSSGGTIYVKDSSNQQMRERWAFMYNERIGGFGSPQAAMKFQKVDKLIIEGNIESLSPRQSQAIVDVTDCPEVLYKDNIVNNGKYIRSRNSNIKMVGENLPEIVEI